MSRQRWKPSATVAAIMAGDDGRYLLVEEHTPEGVRLNNPAGHLDPGESPEQGCAREALEETAYPFTPTHLVGIYLARFQRARVDARPEDVTYLRFAYCGTVGALDPTRKLDKGIIRAVWMTPDEIRNTQPLHRSPLVWQSVQDHIDGRRFDMSLVNTHPSVWSLQSP
ncbi:NUDIX hydrolase [Burkholderiaceae bacterium]|nr:NUDIX hydrolase [Burkholderiaceae bacterium]